MSDGRYKPFRQDIPSAGMKYVDRYQMPSEDLQNLQQQNPDVLYVQTLDLSVARPLTDPLEINTPGRAITLLGYSLSGVYAPQTNVGTEPSEPGVFVSCRINFNREENAYPLKHNRGFRGNFTKLFLTWPAQANMGAKIIIFRYDATPWVNNEADNRFSGRVEASNITTQSAATVTSTAAALLPADLSRKVSTIFVNGAQTIFVGDANVTAATGIPVPQNAYFYWRNTAPLYAIVSSTSNTDVRRATEY